MTLCAAATSISGARSMPFRYSGNSSRLKPVLQAGWGGTSFVAPKFNGSTAVIDSDLGHRIGLWNPSVYSFAAGPASPVTPLSQASSSNDNIFFTGNPGELYNAATGLGVPNLAKFASDLAKR